MDGDIHLQDDALGGEAGRERYEKELEGKKRTGEEKERRSVREKRIGGRRTGEEKGGERGRRA